MKVLALLLLIGSNLLIISSAVATPPVDTIQADLSRLTEQAQNESSWRLSQAAAIADLLARQAALPAQLNPDKKAASEWLADAAKFGVKDKLLQAAAAPNFLSALPPDLRDLAKKCVVAGANASTPPAGSSFEISDCDQAARDKLASALKDAETHAELAYEHCRNVVQGKAPEYQDLVPANAHDTLAPTALTALESYPNKDVSNCAGELKQAAAELKDVKDAKALFSSALTLAANVCFASGGNPWVCGGMLVVAFIMEIFDGSGGGKGDGPADGVKGGAGGGQSVPTVNAGPPRESKAESDAREATSNDEITQGPSANLGHSANLGTPGAEALSKISPILLVRNRPD